MPPARRRGSVVVSLWPVLSFLLVAAASPALASAAAARPEAQAAEASTPAQPTKPSPRVTRYVQVTTTGAAITVSPAGEFVARVPRGMVLELARSTPGGYEVVLHTGERRFLRRQAARPVLYRPLEIEAPALRQQLLSALVEADARARAGASGRDSRASGRDRRQSERRLAILTDRYALEIAERFSLNPPVVSALAARQAARDAGAPRQDAVSTRP